MSSKIKQCPTYTEDFKRQLVALHSHGKRKVDLVREYGISPAALDRWVKQANKTGSFKTKDNLNPEQLEIRQLKKQLEQSEINNDTLKQAALIFARKDNL